jgi:hypothetical protein
MNTHSRHSLLFILIGIVILIILGLNFSTHSLYAQNSMHSGHVINNTISKYTGQENRLIKSLSPEDIESLQTGTGDAFGGMAKLAELNGYPGPRHVLDLANELELSNKQKANITTIYDNMKKKAAVLGQEIISIEKIANEEFINKTITDYQMKQLIFKKFTNLRTTSIYSSNYSFENTGYSYSRTS